MQDAGCPKNYKSALDSWKAYKETCAQKQGQYNDFLEEWLTAWASKHTRPGTDITKYTKWLKDEMSRRRAKGPPDPLLDKNRPTKEGWQHWVEWGRNYAPPGLPKDDRSEQPSQEEPSQEEQKGNRVFRGKSFPGRTAPRVATAGGGAGGGGSSGSSSPGDRRGVGRSQSRSSQESVAGNATKYCEGGVSWKPTSRL
jgi:hypothetical protein